MSQEENRQIEKLKTQARVLISSGLIALVPGVFSFVLANILGVFCFFFPGLVSFSLGCIGKLMAEDLQDAYRWASAWGQTSLDRQKLMFCPNFEGRLLFEKWSGIHSVDSSYADYEIESPTMGSEGKQTCMVCDMPLNVSAELVWCPYCGRAAHKVHLLEWLHVKNFCPACHQRLREHRVLDHDPSDGRNDESKEP